MIKKARRRWCDITAGLHTRSAEDRGSARRCNRVRTPGRRPRPAPSATETAFEHLLHAEKGKHDSHTSARTKTLCYKGIQVYTAHLLNTAMSCGSHQSRNLPLRPLPPTNNRPERPPPSRSLSLPGSERSNHTEPSALPITYKSRFCSFCVCTAIKHLMAGLRTAGERTMSTGGTADGAGLLKARPRGRKTVTAAAENGEGRSREPPQPNPRASKPNGPTGTPP
ncbi:hypothetical protein AAFF_G00049610 [Aldrovandia affinis]|uniref:Uncharacterized protein n=1 Tax=Aldrovandia affinis TaxID=143900 RepID=A0AAD7S194_9TELE|nr:hypothetical protein AAFF_G00049610 [Aldrovandia affinis]